MGLNQWLSEDILRFIFHILNIFNLLSKPIYNVKFSSQMTVQISSVQPSKCIIILNCCLFFFVSGLTQSGKTYVSSNNIWQSATSQMAHLDRYTQFTFSIDSIKLGNHYYKEQMYDHYSNPGWKGTKDYYRERNGKVYQYNGTEIGELCYDFTLNIGDRLRDATNGELLVTKKDSITTLDGLTRTRLTFKQFCGNSEVGEFIWIEGIGNITSVNTANNICIIYDPVSELNCFLVNNKPVYNVAYCKDVNAYKSIIHEDYIWQTKVSGAGIPNSQFRLYKFDGRKTIENKIYTELKVAENPKLTSILWRGTERYFREENQKFIEYRNNKDITLMDYSLNKGDSFKIEGFTKDAMTVTKTDTVLFKDNKPRKRLYLKCSESQMDHDVIWVEGCGDISNFIQTEYFCSAAMPLESISLFCFLQDNYLDLYKADGVLKCFVGTSHSETIIRSKLKIFPNPTFDILNIESNDTKIKLIRLIDISGKIVYLSSDNQNHLSIDILPYQSGIYFCKVVLMDGTTYLSKVIKY
jgi:hypothetical protein